MGHLDLNIEEVAILTRELSLGAIKAIIVGKNPANAKYGKRTLGQLEALQNILGDEAVDKLLLGRCAFVLEEVVRPLFDKNGRFIPFPGLKAAVCDPNPKYHFNQSESSNIEILERDRRHLAVGLGVETASIALPSATEFEDRVLAIKAKLDGDECTKKETKGNWFPWVLPRLEGDYGELLDKLVSAVASAYKEAYPNRSFTNYRKNELAGQTKVVPGTRHEQIVEAVAKRPVVGITLLPFGGYSINACRETFVNYEPFKQIPDWLILGGGFDLAAIYIAFAKELMRDEKTPIVRCPALSWQSSYSLHWSARGGYAYFDRTDRLSSSGDDYCAPVSCLG
ncbi:MAG: hypothetical protein AAB358_03925 [Patescibacteria group bacterium]